MKDWQVCEIGLQSTCGPASWQGRSRRARERAARIENVTARRLLGALVVVLSARLANAPLLCRKDLMRRYGFGKTTLHYRCKLPGFPRPIRISGPRWRLADLEAAERAGLLPGPVSG